MVRLILKGRWEVGKERGFSRELLFKHFLLLDRFPCGAPALDPLLGQLHRQGLPRHFRPQHTPDTRHDAKLVVATSAQSYPPAMTIGMCEPVGAAHLSLDTARGQFKMGQRIPVMGIAAMLADDDVGGK